jgi:hypothetical protein
MAQIHNYVRDLSFLDRFICNFKKDTQNKDNDKVQYSFSTTCGSSMSNNKKATTKGHTP